MLLPVLAPAYAGVILASKATEVLPAPHVRRARHAQGVPTGGFLSRTSVFRFLAFYGTGREPGKPVWTLAQIWRTLKVKRSMIFCGSWLACTVEHGSALTTGIRRGPGGRRRASHFPTRIGAPASQMTTVVKTVARSDCGAQNAGMMTFVPQRLRTSAKFRHALPAHRATRGRIQ